ncbi:MAG: hypothetical protein NZ561_06705 [Phycisphaerae bacterium]|nr:hypothetical protein [Phycisphaerae bacterium]MDW8261451.1 hypothetical protein [Phycisphaerales bacterium]
MDSSRTSSYSWVFAIVLVLSLVIVGVGVYLAAKGASWSMLAAGSVCVVGTLLAWALAETLRWTRAAAAEQLREALRPFDERMEQYSVMLNLISEQQLLSDRGKSIAYRNKDREALKYAIQEEISHGDYEAAWRLADEMENSFGNRKEAEMFRQLIEEKRSDNLRRQISEGVAQVDKLIRAERWSAAHREAQMLLRRFPDHEQVRKLPDEIEARRTQFKKQLIDSFNDAVARKDVDGAIELLKRLDLYVTAEEASALQENAQMIIRTKLERLRTQFAEAVHQANWAEAVRIGDQMIRDFPNTQMARQVRENIEELRQRAAEPAPASG